MVIDYCQSTRTDFGYSKPMSGSVVPQSRRLLALVICAPEALARWAGLTDHIEIWVGLLRLRTPSCLVASFPAHPYRV